MSHKKNCTNTDQHESTPPSPGCGCPPDTNATAKCKRLTEPNVWIERGNHPGSENAIGICLLDTMSEAQVIYVLEHDQKAREDLLKVTDDPRLLELARTVMPLPTQEEADMHQKWFNRTDAPAANPFYAIFRGQPPFAQ
jgi:hypothetical protein